ncbi:MAG: chromosome segregation protein SMC [Gammaproteobacteria bacterium]|jgi:chromosome segregation protein|nr:chromosome segregation protein SMC [Gammaproteobacteria bacterium]
MQLKKIRLAGFKSFVDPTTVAFPSQLVGVVGPNGCGKSNVIDAVRWVMGESSAKHLRGDALADVIFNGSSTRKPVSQATIELVFDNTSGRLGGQFAQYSEISIKRQLTRDGQSTFYLNGSRCRRRDITDIFLGTGLGPRSYAIIEQGTVSRLIEAKPEELRTFLEEAAGISKYKERRRETESRIRDTRENLNRLNDLLAELEKRLGTLQRQAKAAERYRELKQEERTLRAQLIALRCRGIEGDLEQKDRAIAAQENAVEKEVAGLRAAEAGAERQRAVQVEANENFNKIQAEYYSAGSEISRVEQSIQHARERQEQNRRELAELEKARAEVQQHLEQDRGQIAGFERALEVDEPQRLRSAEAEQASAAALADAERAMTEWQSEWDRYNSAAAEHTRKTEVERTRVQHLENALRGLTERLGRLEGEERGLAAESDQESDDGLEARARELDAEIAGLRAEQERLAAEIGAQRQAREQATRALEEGRRGQQGLETRHASLSALQQAALGKQEGVVARWLEAQGWSDLGRLAEGIEVDAGWERAVENVLGLDLEAVCTPDLNGLAARLATLSGGTLAAFDTSAAAGVKAWEGTLAPRLCDRLRAPWPVDALLHGVYAVDTLDEAMALRERLAPAESVVTRDGVWVGCGWLRVVDTKDEKSGVLGREQELRETTQMLARAKAEVAELQQNLQAAATRLSDLERAREESRQKLDGANQRHAEVRAQISRRDASLEQIRRRRERLATEIGDIRNQVARDGETLAAARARLEDLQGGKADHERASQELLQRRDERRTVLDGCRTRAQADRQAAHELAVRMESARSRINVLSAGLERAERRLAQIEQQHGELSGALEGSEAPIVALKQELDALLERRLQVEARLADARRQFDECDHALREFEKQRAEHEQRLQEQREALERIRLSRQELAVRRQGFMEQLQESGHALADVLAAMPEEADDSEWQRRLSDIEQKISRMGAINLAAIDEFAEQSERKNYLDAQLADLNEALETLETAIRKIDAETRMRFKETFDQVNERLGELYPRLFGGGFARLEMTSDDLLDAGVTIMARPPGKRNVNIHQLSGGEKALTAVAMVFAMFELNPAPFCMLDEVDAPLDDANASRFCNMVREMSDRVQFIFITHNKITMELANQLVGVTMHEPGVSRLVAVDVDEAVEMVG